MSELKLRFEFYFDVDKFLLSLRPPIKAADMAVLSVNSQSLQYT